MEPDKISLSRRWTGIVLLASFFILGMACLILLAVEVRNYKAMARQNLTVTAGMLAADSSVISIYDDKKLAEAIIASLREDPEIAAAAFYDQHGKIYAIYPADSEAALFPVLAQPNLSILSARELTVFKPIFQGKNQVGTLYLKASLPRLFQQSWLYALILLNIMIGAGFLILALAAIFQKRIYLPILEFARAIQQISQTKNYSLRAPRTREHELGHLTDAFNSLLDQVEESNAAQNASEEFSRSIFNGCTDSIVVLDLDGRMITMNRGGMSLLEMDDFVPFTNKNWADVWPETIKLQACRAMEDAKTGGSGIFQGPCVTLNGNLKWCDVIVSPIRNKSEKVVRLVAMARDMSEQRAVHQKLVVARQQAEAASRSKDDFLAALSHELRTPLNVVLLLASNAAEGKNLTPEVKTALELIRQNAELEARLIDDLLDLTSITRGKVALHNEWVDVHSVVQNALAAVRSDLNQKRIMLILKLDAAEHVVWGDPIRLQQVLWNLLKNAVKFTPDNGQITVQTTRASQSDKLKIMFIDSGIGMSGEELTRIFGAFAQGDHAAQGGAQRFGGLGLGLAIAKNFIELHAGHIHATSNGRNQGSVFTVELPLGKNPAALENSPPLRMAAAHVPPAVANAKRAGLRILLVEDHQPSRLALASLLNFRHYSVAAVGSVAEALALAKQEKFELVISDIGLPDGNGNDLMAELKSLYSLKGIALTGYGMEQDISRCLEAGFETHLTKPVRVQFLEQALNLVASR